MKNAYCLYGGAPRIKKLKLGATIAKGVLSLQNAAGGLLPCTTTSAISSFGIALDGGTYSTTQGDPEGVASFDISPHVVIRARISGGATEGTDMTKLSNTSAESAGTTITDADTGSADMDSGTVWRLVNGGQSSESRIITTHNGSTDFVVTVPFLQDIASGDEFLFAPYSIGVDAAVAIGTINATPQLVDGFDTLLIQSPRGVDAAGNVQTTAAFTEANGAIASGTGQVANVIELLTFEEGNSFVDFLTGDHALNYALT